MKNKLKLLGFARLAFVGLAFLAIDSQRPSKGEEIFWEELRISTSSQKPFSKVESYDEQDILWIPLSSDGSSAKQVVWEECNTSCIAWNESIDSSGNKIKPNNIEDAIELLNSQPLVASDYLPLLRLGAPVQTANIVNDLEGSRFSFYQLAPFAGGGAGGGTGNQNYIGTIDFGINNVLQLSGFYSEADDPLFSTVVINGLADNPSNFWQSFGGGAKFILGTFDNWKIAGAGSIETWNVGSGGTLGKNQISQSGSPNIFNGQDRRVFTKNIVGSLAMPISWQANRSLELTFTPGASFLPTTQGIGQGGAGQFYGTSITIGTGAAWKPSDQLTLFGSGLFPFGPGTNSFNAELVFQRVPILSGGLNYALNPRIGLEASMTNGFGGTPATSILSLPSANQLMYSARMIWSPQSTDSPEIKFNERSRSLSMGGVSVSTAIVPPASVFNLWANADNKGNLFSQVGWSASNDFQFILFNAGAFQGVSPETDLVSSYANNGGVNQRFGGKAVFLQQLRGAPVTASGSITLGRNYDASSFQGYLFAEAIGTWEANKWLAFNLNPKLAWSGIDTPFGIGFSANIQLNPYFQLISEVNVVTSYVDASNATCSLRWLPRSTTALDIYVSNAAGIYDIGQLLDNDSTRLGVKLTIQL